MITIHRVTNPIDPTRDRQTRTLDAGPYLNDFLVLQWCFEGSPLEYLEWAKTVIVSVNGHIWAEQSDWHTVNPKDGDFIVIAPVVQGGSLLRTIATLAVMATAAFVTFGGSFAFAGFALQFGGLGLGAAASSLAVGAISVAGNLLVSALLGPSQSSNKNSSASYDPDGPKSLAQSGVVIPKGYGTFRWGGNIISSFSEIAGTDTFINVLVCFGFGPARSLSSIQINGKDISTYQNCQYYTRLGTNDQTEIAQFNEISNGYSQDTQCLAGIPVVVPGTGDLTQALQVDIQFPEGVFVDTNDGHIIPAFVTWLLEYRVSGTNNWQPVCVPQNTTPVTRQNPNGSAYLPFAWGAVATDLAPNSNVVYHLDNGPHVPGDPYTATENLDTFDPNGVPHTTQKTVRGEWQLLDINQNYEVVLSWTNGYQSAQFCQTTPCYFRTNVLGLAPNKYDVRITKYGSARVGNHAAAGDNFSPNIGQDMWVHSVNEITYLDLAYPNMILLGVRALATTQLSGQNLNVTAIVEHGLRTRDEGLMPAELLAYEEDNPACVAADMMLDDLYGGGAWPGITAANLTRFIDEWIGWAENNDTLVPDGNGNSVRMCVFNGVFDNESDLWNQAGVVTSMSRACLVPVGLDYGVALDALVSAPVQMFTVGNILQDSFSETWLELDSRSNQVEVQFADATRYYKEDNPLVYMDPALQNTGSIPKVTRIRGKGITLPAQAWHHARYKERAQQFLLRTGSFRTDTDGIACRPFNVIALQHDVPQWGFGGRTLPGSTASLLLLDRDDVTFEAGQSYSVMVQHPALQRFTGTVGAVATSTSPPGYTITLSAWPNAVRVTRAIINGSDCAILSPNVGSVTVSPPPGFVPQNGQIVSLWDTDLLESVPVTGLDPETGGLVLGAPLSRVPEEYSSYIYGITGTVKWARVTNIKRASEQRSTIEWIDYAADVYDIAIPIIGETSAQVTSNPGVTSLLGSEIFQTVGGNNVGFASLSWKLGPDTVGVGIYASFQGSTSLPQLVARLTGSPTSWQGQQSPNTTYTYTVVGFDVNNLYQAFTAAPSVTIGAVGITANLLLGSSFQSGFTFWSVTPRAGDSLIPVSTNDDEAVYTVQGSALTAATAFGFQVVDPAKWAVGEYLMLSAYAEDTAAAAATAPNVGTAVATLSFASTTGTTPITTTLPLSGVAPGLARMNTAAVLVPAGTVAVYVSFGVAPAPSGTVHLSIGSTVTFSHFLLEVATAGQPAPSTWADLDSQGQIVDLFQVGSSSGLRAQGSLLPSFTGTFNYTSTDTQVVISWSNLVVLWPDGAYTQIQSGTLTFTGLTASKTYWAFLYFDIHDGAVEAVTPTTPIGTPAMLSAAYDAYADAACKQDGRIGLTSGGFQMTTGAAGTTTTGGGTTPPTTGSGTSNPHPVDCTLRGTSLPTPAGLTCNIEIEAAFRRGEEVFLMGRDGWELVTSAFWVQVDHWYKIAVEGHTTFGASSSLTLKSPGRDHRWCSRLCSGCLVETRNGYRPVEITRVGKPGQVLHIELAGPSHEYLVSDGVWTHNYYKVDSN